MRHFALIAAVAAALAACSDPGASEPADAPAAATLPPGRPAVYQAATEGPEPFVRAVYAMYEANAAGEPPPPGRDPIYGRTFNAAVGADFRQNRDQVPFLNFDPVCGCQDGQVRLTSVTVTPTERFKADALVGFTVDGQAKSQTLKLEREGQSWKIADVVPAGETSLLERIIATLE
jgi:hypothetical protein